MTTKLQAPPALTGTIQTSTGNTYVVNALGQIDAQVVDVLPLLGAGFLFVQVGAAATTATGTGQAISQVGGAGGATSGAGGASTNVGGAATAGNSAGGAAGNTGGAGSGSSAGGAATNVGGAGGATGAGGAAGLIGGAGGATSGNGGAATATGGAATAGNGSGGSVVLTGGAKNGTGIDGGIRMESLIVRKQGTPAAKTTSATLTAAEILTGLVTINQGAGATSAQQLPAATDIIAALPADFATDDSFDVVVSNISTVDAEDASCTTNTGLTLVGSMDFPAHSGITLYSTGILRFRKTGASTMTVYRVG